MKRKSNNKKYILLVMVGVAYAIYILGIQQIQFYKQNQKINQNNITISQLEKDTKKLQRVKEKHESDEFIEKIAREKLGYVKPGEKIYIDMSKK